MRSFLCICDKPGEPGTVSGRSPSRSGSKPSRAAADAASDPLANGAPVTSRAATRNASRYLPRALSEGPLRADTKRVFDASSLDVSSLDASSLDASYFSPSPAAVAAAAVALASAKALAMRLSPSMASMPVGSTYTPSSLMCWSSSEMYAPSRMEASPTTACTRRAGSHRERSCRTAAPTPPSSRNACMPGSGFPVARPDRSPSGPSALTSVHLPLYVPETSDGNGAGKDARVHDAEASEASAFASTYETSVAFARTSPRPPRRVPADAPDGSSKSSGSPNSTTRVNSFRLDMSAAPASACAPWTPNRAPPPASPRRSPDAPPRVPGRPRGRYARAADSCEDLRSMNISATTTNW